MPPQFWSATGNRQFGCQWSESHAYSSTVARQVEPLAGWERRSPVMVDAPVSGGVSGAQAAALTFMVCVKKPSLCSGCKAAFLCGQHDSHAPVSIRARHQHRIVCINWLQLR